MSNIKNIFKKVYNFLKDVLAPKKCYSCNKEGFFLCEECFFKLNNYNGFCIICRKKSDNFEIHKKCLIENKILNGKNFNNTKIFLDKVIVVTHYKNDVIKKLIKDFKFFGKKDIGEELGIILGKFIEKYVKNYNTNNIIIIPVPLHFLKKIKRGFNQTEILSKNIGQINNINYYTNIIYRGKNTRQQSKISRQDRLINLNNAFKINENIVDKIDNKNILLVDDVITTGTTLNEVAKVLKQNGAKKVIGVCLASN